MRDVMRTIKVLLILAKMQISAQMMYRLSFFGTFVCDMSLFLIQLLFFKVVSSNGAIGDWGLYHLTVFTGTFIALDGLYMATYFFGIIALPDKIRTGDFDLAITKPVNTLLYTTFGTVDMGAFLVSLVGIGIVIYGGFMLEMLSVTGAIQFTIVFFLMYILMYSLMLCIRCFAFWLTRINAFEQVEITFVDFSFKLPAPAIDGVWKIILFVVLPYGLMANMPARALFGIFGWRQWLLCFLVTAFFLMLALLMWHFGRRVYDSASS